MQQKDQDMDLTDEEISRLNSQSTLDSTLDINTEEEIVITFSSGQDSEIIISSNYDIVQCIVEDEGEYIFPFAEQDFSGDPEHTAAAERISNLKDRVDNTRNSLDEELQTLLSEMKAKYTCDTRAIGCFPENPRRSENENYIVFNETEDENRVGSVYWCQCGNCIPMRTNIESVCCKEITNAEPLMDNLNCITEHELFNIFCNRVETVTVNLISFVYTEKEPSKKDMNSKKPCTTLQWKELQNNTGDGECPSQE
ncbi:uncharacterized protein LOC120997715 [Bufo bufo]|uniref:uncharacterized protein LOC120997715 n=1 Tax=Bufo bufo TaxID=8384 RepID=UPI001ABE3C90|nr:uncharacterized protein LOC120997715 [Bufo bufo]